MFSDTNWWYSKPPCSSFQEQQVKFKGFLQWISKLVDFKVAFVSYSWSVVGSKASWFIYTLPKYHGTSQDHLPLKGTPHYISSKMHFPGCYELLYTPLSGSTQPIWKTSHGSWNPKVQGEICAKSLQPPPIVLGYLHPPGIFIVPFTPFTTRLQTSSNSTSTMSSGSRRFKIPVPFHLSKFQKFKTFLTLMYDSYFIASSNILTPKQKSVVYFIPQISPNNQGELVTGISPEVNHRKWWCCRPTFSPYQVEQQ